MTPNINPDRTLANDERGCGYLEGGKAYIRGTIGSPDGILPSFVRCDPPVPYREQGTDGGFTRGYLQFDGTSSQFALQDVTTFKRMYPGDATESKAMDNMVDRGLYPNTEAIPAAEAQRHVDRIEARGAPSPHFGSIPTCRQSDLLMRAGKTHYPDPADFMDEAVDRGISKAIPLSKRQEPPVIEPGVTRCWILHPETTDGWAIIGYAYLQEVVYTMPDDGNVPQYVQEYHAADRLDVVDFEDPPAQDDDPNADLHDFDGEAPEAADTDADGDDADTGETSGDNDDADSDPDSGGTTVVADQSDSAQDVREVDPERDVAIYQNGPTTHLAAIDGDTLLCGRDLPADDPTHGTADPSTIVAEYDGTCGTCLSALKARVEDDDV